MKLKLIQITIFIFVNVNVWGQPLYSKTYSPDSGTTGTTIPRNLLVIDDEVFIPSGTIEISSNQRTCIIDKMDLLTGDKILSSKLFQGFGIANENVIHVKSSQIEVLGHLPNSDPSSFLKLRTNLDFQNVIIDTIATKIEIEKLFIDGILTHNQFNFIWGDISLTRNDSNYATVIKTNETLDTVLDIFLFNQGTAENHADDLQLTPQGNLAFINRSFDRTGNTNEFYRINEIDLNGNLLSTLEYEEKFFLGQPPNLAIDDEGSYIFCTSEHTRDEFQVTYVACYNHVSKTEKWRTKLPNDGVMDLRVYAANDISIARNGDILLCGTMFDQIPGVGEEFVGFLARLSSDGNLLWIRNYILKNSIEPQILGSIRLSGLISLQELDDESIIAVGTADQPLSPQQINTEVWLLRVNSEGCLQQGCADTSIVVNTNDYKGSSNNAPVNVFPNPSRYTLNIDIPYNQFQVRIISTSGKLEQTNFNTKEINIDHLLSGVYILQIFIGDNVYHSKFIKN